MFRFSLLLLGAVFLHTLLTQTTLNNTDLQNYNAVNLTFIDKVLDCKIVNKGGPLILDPEQCHMFLYISNKPLSEVSGTTISHKYTALLKVTARCAATCTNDTNIRPMELEINTVVFIGMCAGAGVVFLLLVVAIICGVRHCRGKYRQLPQDTADTEEKEKNIPLTATA